MKTIMTFILMLFSILTASNSHANYTGITSTDLPDSNSPNYHYALPWRSHKDDAACVSPSEMTYYQNVLEGIRSSYETTYYPTYITDYTLTETSYVKTGQPRWKVNFYFEMAFVNCVPDGGGAD